MVKTSKAYGDREGFNPLSPVLAANENAILILLTCLLYFHFESFYRKDRRLTGFEVSQGLAYMLEVTGLNHPMKTLVNPVPPLSPKRLLMRQLAFNFVADDH